MGSCFFPGLQFHLKCFHRRRMRNNVMKNGNDKGSRALRCVRDSVNDRQRVIDTGDLQLSRDLLLIERQDVRDRSLSETLNTT